MIRASGVAVLLAAAGMSAAFQAATVLSRDAIIELLRSGRAPSDVAVEVQRRGAGFRLNAQDESQLTAAGANAGLIDTVRGHYRPVGQPIPLADLKLLLELRAPRGNLELLLQTRGVDFAVTPQVAGEIITAGGDSALVGLVALNQRAAASAAPPPPKTEETAADPSSQGRLPVERAAPVPGATGGQCDLRVRVDHITEFLIHGDRVGYLVQRGAPPVDAGSTCTGPLPETPAALVVAKVRGRGTAGLVENPAAGNGYTGRIRVTDESGGADLYHVRVSWAEK